MKCLKLSPEYHSSPLWLSGDDDFFENLEITASDFDEGLKNKIFEWAQKFDETLNQDYPPESGFSSLQDEKEFEQKGVEIWQDIVEHYSNHYSKIFFKSYRLGKLYSEFVDYKKDLDNQPIQTKPR